MRRKFFFVVLTAIFSVALQGCDKRSSGGSQPVVKEPEVREAAAGNAALRVSFPQVKVAADPLGAAHQAYLQAYENYVRSLRESGPQTLETLQSLADYQKKYQIYLMLVKAEGKMPKEP